MPAVYFHYEISPIMARFAEGRRSLSSFLTGLCAIIGAPAEIYRDRSEIDTNLCAITVARAATNLLAPHDPPPSEIPRVSSGRPPAATPAVHPAGGVFTVAGMVDSCIHRVSRATKVR